MVTFKTLRIDSKQTREEIAEKLGNTLNSYAKYEYSERIPSSKALLELKDAYNCSSDDILLALKFHIERFNYKKNLRKNKTSLKR